MSMICNIQAFKSTDVNYLINNAQIAQVAIDGETCKSAFPVGLMLIEIIALLVIFGHSVRQFPRYWYIWLIIVLVLFSLLRLSHRGHETGKQKNVTRAIKPEAELCLDKAWHGIHYLLTLSAWEGEKPYCYLVKGGTEIGSQACEYGRSRLLNPEQTNQFCHVISSITTDFLRERYIPEKMKQLEIYPNEWDNKDEIEYLQDYYEELKLFLEGVSKSDCCLVISIS